MTDDRLTPQKLQQTLAELSAYSLQAGVPEELRKAIQALELSQIELELHNSELQEAQKQLEDSRCRYADLFDNAPIGYLTLDERGTIVSANNTATLMLGQTRAEILGSSLGAFVKDQQAFHDYMERCHTADGKDRLRVLAGHPVCGGPACAGGHREGNPAQSSRGGVEFRTTITDISALKKAQEELDKVRLLLIQAIQSAKLTVWSRDVKAGLVRMWSPSHPCSKLEGSEWQGTVEETYAMIHPEDVDRVREVIEGTIAHGSDFRLEMRVRNADGSYRWSESRGHVRRDAQSVPLVLEGISLRIDELKRSEELLQDVARFPEENPSPVLRCRQDGSLLYANPASEELLGAVGVRIGESLPEPFLAAVREAFATSHNQMLNLKIGDKHFSFQVVPIRDLSYVNLYGRDVTAQIKTEEVVQRQADLIELSPDAMFVRTLDGQIVFWSKGAEKLYGFTKEEAVGRTSAELP